MNKKEFAYYRKRFGKTQKQMAELLGTSLKAVHSYEQGWRRVPAHVERQVLYLASRKLKHTGEPDLCWDVKGCSTEYRNNCPAWEFQAGKLCWFINGTFCEGAAQKDWREKMKVCRRCEVLSSLLPRDAGVHDFK